MTIVTISSARRFIENAPFPKRARALDELSDNPPVSLKDTDAQSLVVGSGLIVAAENVPKQTREDLINCILFAQLAASGVVGQAKHLEKWYEEFFTALTRLGWAQSDTQFEDYRFSSNKAEAHKAIIQILTVLLGPAASALVVVKSTLEALQTMNTNSPWITLFDSQSRQGKSARFQVATAQIDSAGLLQIALCAFILKARSKLVQVLFFKFSSSSTRLKYAAGKATIYEEALKSQREAIAARLEADRSAYVGQVKFPPRPAARVSTKKRMR